MRNLDVSYIKILMLLFFTLAIFYSCIDDDLFIDTMDQNMVESIKILPDIPLDPTSPDSTAVNPPENNSTICNPNGGKAYDTGLKVFCWENIEIPSYSGKRGINISNDQLFIDNECNEQGVTKVGNELRFYVNPSEPTTKNKGSWCDKQFNMRSEIRTHPWKVNNPQGTEEWFGFTYRFGPNYKPDQDNQWLFFQVHSGGGEPTTELRICKNKQYTGHPAGEIFVVNKGNTEELPTGIVPKANEKLKVVIHAIWDYNNKGLLQVWINDVLVHNKNVSTIYADFPWGGNAKFGIYKWPWKDAVQVQKSHDQGIYELETFLGSLKMITRKPGDIDYGKDSYSLVAP